MGGCFHQKLLPAVRKCKPLFIQQIIYCILVSAGVLYLRRDYACLVNRGYHQNPVNLFYLSAFICETLQISLEVSCLVTCQARYLIVVSVALRTIFLKKTKNWKHNLKIQRFYACSGKSGTESHRTIFRDVQLSMNQVNSLELVRKLVSYRRK